MMGYQVQKKIRWYPWLFGYSTRVWQTDGHRRTASTALTQNVIEW